MSVTGLADEDVSEMLPKTWKNGSLRRLKTDFIVHCTGTVFATLHFVYVLIKL